MQHEDHSMHELATGQPFWRSPIGFALIAFLAIAVILLGYEHRVHIFGGTSGTAIFLVVWFGLHFLMHRGHGGHGGHGHHSGHGRSTSPKASADADQATKGEEQ